MRRRRDVEEEKVGSRSFEVQRSRAVEMALARLRHGVEEHWELLLPEEIKALEWMLRETWAVVGTQAWKQIGFSRADPALVEEIIAVAEKALAGEELQLLAVRRVRNLLATLPPPGEAAPGPPEGAR